MVSRIDAFRFLYPPTRYSLLAASSGNAAISASRPARSGIAARGRDPPSAACSSRGVIAQKSLAGSRSRQSPACIAVPHGKGWGR
jgi:hypothetical protein